MPKKLTIQDFIDRARKVHGDKFDYLQVHYVSTHIKVKIICPAHGVFEQTPNNHLITKNGCPYCGRRVQLTTRDFIVRAQEVHGDKFGYSQVNYLTTRIKGNIDGRYIQWAPARRLFPLTKW